MQQRRRNRITARRGGVLVYVLCALVLLLGMAALAIDVAMLYAARRRAQNVADAAALAAGPLLPNATIAENAARQVATANNATGPAFTVTSVAPLSGTNTQVTLDDGTTLNLAGGAALTVTGYIDAPMSFAPVVGYRPTSQSGRQNTRSVSASATIIVRSACSLPGGIGMAPFGVVADDSVSTDPNVAYMADLLTTALNSQTPLPNTYQPLSRQVPLKVSRWQNGTLDSGGNFGALDLGGNGANAYRDAISTPTTRQFMVGEEIPTKPGNMVGPTQQGMSNRLSSSNTAFTHRYTNYIDWFFGDQSLPVDTSMPPVTDGNQTYYYRQDPHRQELSDARVMIIPLISQPSKNGRTNAVILAFAAFYVESSGSTVNGRFIGVMLPNGGNGSCTGGGAFQWPRLIR